MLALQVTNLITKRPRFKTLVAWALVIFCALPLTADAAMQSANYIIYENIHHTFDGPAISNVSASVNLAIATLTWNTDIIADSFVVYDTDSAFPDSMEQGTSVKNSAAHSVSLSGLEENTTYYYRVKSTRVNGGTSIDTTQRSFTTGSATLPGEGEEEDQPGGGGILIIDKTDKLAPLISDISVTVVDFNAVRVEWKTDEESTSFVEYGLTTAYGSTFGNWATSTNHSVVLNNLQPETQYHFRALSSDGWGNLGKGEDSLFSTDAGLIEEGEEGEEGEVDAGPDEKEGAISLEEATRRALEFIRRLFPQVSLNAIGNDPFTTITDLNALEEFMPVPILSGEPRVEVTATEARIFWTTDIESNSLVAIAPQAAYREGNNEPYQQVVGEFDDYTTEHEVRLFGLTPDTIYHFQLRSKPVIGPTAASRDFTFTTTIEELTITSFFVQVIDNESAIFKWTTNKESDSAAKFAPYHDNVIAVDQQKTIKANAFTVIHEVEVKEFVAGTMYAVELISIDAQGNTAREVIPRFSTSEDDLPPSVSHIKADSTIFVDRSNKIQTIVSWLTNEPSTSRVYFMEGVHGGETELSESTELNTNYTKEHVMVITKFKSGIVYSFRVESIDSGGNIVVSKAHTFMTAKKQESIIQIIIRIFENTFSWVNKLK